MGFTILPVDVQKSIFQLTLSSERSGKGNLNQIKANSLVCKTWKLLNQSNEVWTIPFNALKRTYSSSLKTLESLDVVKDVFKKFFEEKKKKLLHARLGDFVVNRVNPKKEITLNAYNQLLEKRSVNLNQIDALPLLFEMLRLNLIGVHVVFEMIMRNYFLMHDFDKFYILGFIIHHNYLNNVVPIRLQVFNEQERINILTNALIYEPFNAHDWIKAGVKMGCFKDFIGQFLGFYKIYKGLDEKTHQEKIVAQFPEAMRSDLRKSPVSKKNLLEIFEQILRHSDFDTNQPLVLGSDALFKDVVIHATDFAESLKLPEIKSIFQKIGAERKAQLH